MKIKNRRYIIVIDKNEYNFLDTITFDNGKPRYFKDKKSAINFLKKSMNKMIWNLILLSMMELIYYGLINYYFYGLHKSISG